MSRPLKFRAWNKDANCFFTEDHVKEHLFGFLSKGFYPVMQYTGLKDKNGTEIYEGDVLQVELGLCMDSSNPESDKMFLRVYWLDGCWMVSGVSGWSPLGYSDWTLSGTLNNGANESVKVIGNCFENPELLSGERT